MTKIGELITPTFTLDTITDDPDDNRILECAVAGKADVIVSGDRHLPHFVLSFQDSAVISLSSESFLPC